VESSFVVGCFATSSLGGWLAILSMSAVFDLPPLPFTSWLSLGELGLPCHRGFGGSCGIDTVVLVGMVKLR